MQYVLASVDGANSKWPVYTPGEVACSIGMFSLFGTMAAYVKRTASTDTRINYLCACIAINLSLTIVFNINPKKRRTSFA
jgi:hypothetical protein